MDNNKLPVYLDCNYDELEKFISELNSLKDETRTLFKDSTSIIDVLQDKLKYVIDSKSLNNAEYLYLLIERLKSTVSETVKRVKERDEKSRELLRDFVDRSLSYTKPIDRNKYSHLEEEDIEKLYNIGLEEDSTLNMYSCGTIIDKYLKEGNNPAVVEAVTLALTLSSMSSNYNYSHLILGYRLGNKENKEEILNLMEDDIPINVYLYKGEVEYHLSKERFKEINDLLVANDKYDEQTLLCIEGGINSRKNGKSDLIDNNTLINLKFGDLEKEITLNDLYQYCKDNSFNYYSFFKENIFDENISDNTNILFNLSGVDIDVNVGKIKEAISLMKEDNELTVTMYFGDVTQKPYDNVDDSMLKFIKGLIDSNTFSYDELLKDRNINIMGKDTYISLKTLNDCFTDGNFDVKKLIDSGKLSESSYVYFNNYEQGNLNLKDLDVVASSDAFSFFNEHGSVKQSGVSDLIRNGYTNEIDRLIDFASQTYGMNENHTYILMNSIDSYHGIGACSYADACNMIYGLYDYDPIKFEKSFGYPMLKDDGTINGDQLLLDLYIYTNIGDEESLLINNNGKVEINQRLLDNIKINTNNQETYDFSANSSVDMLNSFLQSKGNNDLNDCDIETIHNNNNEQTYQTLVDAINNKEKISMSLYNNWDIYKLNSKSSTHYTSAHAVTPVAVTKEGVLVRSWGDLYYIPFDDFSSYSILKVNKINYEKIGEGVIYAKYND